MTLEEKLQASSACQLDGRETALVYLHLKARESKLRPAALRLLGKLEKVLYEALSIEEMEALPQVLGQPAAK